MEIKDFFPFFYMDYSSPKYKELRLRPVVYRCRDISEIIKTKIESNEYIMGKSEAIRKKLLKFLTYSISIAQSSHVSISIDINEDSDDADVIIDLSSTMDLDLGEIIQLSLICEAVDSISIIPPDEEYDKTTIYLKMSLDENFRFKDKENAKTIVRPRVKLIAIEPPK